MASIIIRNYRKLGGISLKSSRIRDFQEINTESQISDDSELGGFRTGSCVND